MKTVAIIGFGTMGRAISKIISDKYKVVGLDQGDDLSRTQQADFIILAVKPQVFNELSEQLRPFIGEQIVISVMAGLQCGRISQMLGIRSLVRTMPNLGVARGKSVTAVHIFGYVPGKDSKAELSNLLELWGEIVWLDQENDFDGFTAIAGCGPAYFFELTNQLQIAAEKLGFQTDLAHKIANGTLASAASMLDNDTASEKISQVASKGGATEAALRVLKEYNSGEIIYKAVQAAQARSKELSK